MISRALIVLLFVLNLNNTLAWDGCEYSGGAWRCGDRCIRGDVGAEVCKCGGEIFNVSAKMWCCNDNPCDGRGENTWYGEEDKEGRRIGAECNGTALKLEEPCNERCNNHEKDLNRNFNGLVRSYRACNIKTTQCIREDKYLDGDVDCRNRADEEIFQTSIGNTSSLLLDLEQILRSCKTFRGQQGFNCTESSTEGLNEWEMVDFGESNCLALDMWCDHNSIVHKCTELTDKTATGKTTDPQFCGNQTFWEQRSCNHGYRYHSQRCNGDTPHLAPSFFEKVQIGSSGGPEF